MENVNWLSLIISTLIPTIMGMIYYHPKVMGKAWMDSFGMTEEKVRQGNMPVMMIVSIIMAFLLSFFLLNFNNGPGQEGEFDTFGHGAFHGVFVAIVVSLPIYISNGMFEQKSAKNLLINAAFWIICLTLMGGVVDAMNHWPN